MIGWLVNILQSVDFAYTPLEIIETEEALPGLWDDIYTEIWQRRLIKEVYDNKSDGS
ncbi:MAG: hypothetical protein DIU68_018360 [Chloroflexota bacterium]